MKKMIFAFTLALGVTAGVASLSSMKTQAGTLACEGGRCAVDHTSELKLACDGGRCAVEHSNDIKLTCDSGRCAVDNSGDLKLACSSTDCVVDSDAHSA
jgi:hypothetical protein